MFRLIKAELGAECIDVPQGENVLGRGQFLKVTDKRVSRNHALLICTADKLELVPKHKNPCFYRKSGSSNFTILAKDVTQPLQDGDQFSLLPKELIFKVDKTKTATPSSLESHNKEEVAVQEAKKESVEEEKERFVEEEPVEKPEVSLTDHKEDSSLLTTQRSTNGEGTCNDSEGVIKCKPRKLPSWLVTAAAGGSEVKKEVKKTKRAKPPEVVPDSKRTPVAKDATVRPIATEKIVSKDPPDSKACDDELDPSECKANDGDDDDDDDDEVIDVTAKGSDEPTASVTVDKKLPPCPYGKKCYRKNPVHFKEYSHDFDDDVTDDEIIDDDDKPACPYGTSCYRKNPLHRKQYSHNAPPITDTEDSTRTSKRSKRKAKVSALAGDSDDDGELNTYDYNDSFIDDADQPSEENTEYGGESEDSDWAPGDNEDVSELVDEAKDFMSNKKMHKTT